MLGGAWAAPGRRGTLAPMGTEHGSWRHSRFDGHAAGERASRWLARGMWPILVGNFIVLLAAMQHDENRCGQDCFDVGLRTYEPGHSWTSYNNAWQWEAMYVLAVAALVAALAAGFAVWRQDRSSLGARVLPAAALALGVAWVAWRVLAPGVGS